MHIYISLGYYCVDYTSHSYHTWTEIYSTKLLQKVIHTLKEAFARHEISEGLITDNGSLSIPHRTQ